jgi:hypothetical protein
MNNLVVLRHKSQLPADGLGREPGLAANPVQGGDQQPPPWVKVMADVRHHPEQGIQHADLL